MDESNQLDISESNLTNKLNQTTLIQVLKPPNIFCLDLELLDGLQFSRRELDVISCILSGRTAKKIASLLSIHHRTIENHTYNITKKLQCHSRNNIIDIIEKSSQFIMIKEHYSNIVNRSNFEACLKRLANNFKQFPSQIFLFNEEKYSKAFLEFIQQFEKDLKILEIKLEIFQNKTFNDILLNNVQNITHSDKTNAIIILGDLSINKEKDLFNLVQFDLETNQNYYFLFFSILKKLIPKNQKELEESILEFSKNYTAKFEHLSSSTSNNLNLSSPHKPTKPKNFFYQYVVFLIFINIGCFIFPNKDKTLHWNLPRQDHIFVGRTKVLQILEEQLEKSLDKSSNQKDNINAITISACSGLGGIGKTQLALYYAYHSKHPYSLIGWFPAEKPEELKRKLIDFAHTLGYPIKNNSTQDAILFVNQWLKEHPGWLLIFDNVNNYQEIQDVLPEAGGKIILTSRNRNWPSKFNILDLDVMTEDDAILLLKTQMKAEQSRNFNHDIAKSIVKELGYLPLAIAQAGAYIRQTHLSLEEYERLYKKYEKELLANKMIPEGTNSLPVATTWNISFNALATEAKRNNEPLYGLNLLFALSYLSSEKIPQDLLLAWFKEAYPKVTTPELIIKKSIGQLWQYSLINIDKNHDVSVHRLVQNVLRQQHLLKNNDDFYPTLNEEWYKSLLIAINKEFNKNTEIALDEKRQFSLLPHLQSLVHYHDSLFSTSNILKLSLSDVLYDLGFIFSRLSIANSAISYFDRSLRIKESLFGSDHLNTLPVLLRLGMIYRNLGDDIQSEILLEKVLW